MTIRKRLLTALALYVGSWHLIVFVAYAEAWHLGARPIDIWQAYLRDLTALLRFGNNETTNAIQLLALLLAAIIALGLMIYTNLRQRARRRRAQ